ncbi:hypothetical protein Tco_1145961 [Tanacetum coccineum]
MTDEEVTLFLKEVCRSKMLAKQTDQISIKQKINVSLINYVELNQLSKDFGKHFVPQQELSAEQAFWLQTSHPNTDQSDISPVKIEAPRELPKRITPDAITEGSWEFEHTKDVFLNEVIPFLKTLKDIFNIFNKDLLDEITEIKTVFIQMEDAVQQCSDKSYENQNAPEFLEYFENNDLKSKLQENDTTITMLRNHIKSLRETNQKDNIKQDMDEIETINIELEHSVTKLLSKNDLLHKEIEHLKKIYKEQFDSIKNTR